MSKNNKNEKNRSHSAGCGCTPTLFADMIENAGFELSRRQFIKDVTAVGGMLAVGGVASSALTGCKTASKDSKADVIYHGGPILTMIKDGDRVEALAVKNGAIHAVGTLKEVMKLKGSDTNVVDLGGKCLMPGFIDPHSHLVMQSVKFSTANLDPKPIGEVGTIADIQRILKDWIEQKQIEPGKWVIGWGYDDTGIKEKRHPNRDDLDAVSTEHPILLMHISSHLMTGNSKMLEEIGITAKTKDPEGGVIQRKSNNRE
ncbi:MAG: amidohydrolase family protein, partial [Candidatus Aminicenantes bacterium]